MKSAFQNESVWVYESRIVVIQAPDQNACMTQFQDFIAARCATQLLGGEDCTLGLLKHTKIGRDVFTSDPILGPELYFSDGILPCEPTLLHALGYEDTKHAALPSNASCFLWDPSTEGRCADKIRPALDNGNGVIVFSPRLKKTIFATAEVPVDSCYQAEAFMREQGYIDILKDETTSRYRSDTLHQAAMYVTAFGDSGRLLRQKTAEVGGDELYAPMEEGPLLYPAERIVPTTPGTMRRAGCKSADCAHPEPNAPFYGYRSQPRRHWYPLRLLDDKGFVVVSPQNGELLFRHKTAPSFSPFLTATP